jgi:hypothetical protein
MLLTLPRNSGIILYDSSLIFDARLYSDFNPYGGLHITNLRAPLRHVLDQAKSFYGRKYSCTLLEGNINIIINSKGMSASGQHYIGP